MQEKIELVEHRLESQSVFNGRLLHIQRDRVRLPDGKEAIREVVRHPGAVAIIAVHNEELLMVRQYRYALEQVTNEIPAGKLEVGEEPLHCAERELREETGYCGELTFLGAFYSSPGFSDEVIHLYSATELSWDPLTADEDEFLHAVRVPWAEAVQKALNGEFSDLKTAMGILMFAGIKQQREQSK